MNTVGLNELNNIELNAILYYADFLSLLDKSIPVTDSCKYFFIYKTPINIAFIANNKPIYDENNKYLLQSYTEYMLIRDHVGIDGVMSFIDNIGNIGVSGCVDGIRMLRCINQYSRKDEKREAITKYKQHIKNTRYSHLIKKEDGKSSRTECTKYIAHYESSHGCDTKPQIHDGALDNKETTTKDI